MASRDDHDPARVASLSLEVLVKIREELTGLRQDNVGIKAELAQTRAELSGRIDTLRGEIIAQGARSAAGLVDVTHELDGIKKLLAGAFALEERVDAIEADVAELKRRRPGNGG